MARHKIPYTLWERAINLRSYSLKERDEQREEELRDYLSLPLSQTDTGTRWDGVTFPRCLRKSMAELKTESWCWIPGSCLILKAFPSAKSQRNESSNTQTATWGLSSGSALPFPTTACVGRAPRRSGSLLGQKGPSPKCPWVWRALRWLILVQEERKQERLHFLYHDGNKGTNYTILESQRVTEKYLRAGRNITLIKKEWDCR